MLESTNQHHLHLQAFGFVILRQAIDAATLAALTAESDRVIRDATGACFRQRDDQGGIEGHEIPATCERTPISLHLAQEFAPTAEKLVGTPLFLALAQHNLFFDAAGWHTDTGHCIPSIKVAAYLDPIGAANGALRVMPGSHALPEEHFEPVMSTDAFRNEKTWRRATRDTPCHVIESWPGDVIFFDERLWHASVDGHDRRQWSATFVKGPTTSEEEDEVRDYLGSQFVPGLELDYDAGKYPNYGSFFRSTAPERWVTQLERLGAFEAAAKEEEIPTPS